MLVAYRRWSCFGMRGSRRRWLASRNVAVEKLGDSVANGVRLKCFFLWKGVVELRATLAVRTHLGLLGIKTVARRMLCKRLFAQWQRFVLVRGSIRDASAIHELRSVLASERRTILSLTTAVREWEGSAEDCMTVMSRVCECSPLRGAKKSGAIAVVALDKSTSCSPLIFQEAFNEMITHVDVWRRSMSAKTLHAQVALKSLRLSCDQLREDVYQRAQQMTTIVDMVAASVLHRVGEHDARGAGTVRRLQHDVVMISEALHCQTSELTQLRNTCRQLIDEAAKHERVHSAALSKLREKDAQLEVVRRQLVDCKYSAEVKHVLRDRHDETVFEGQS